MIRFWRSLAPFGRWVVGIGLAMFLVSVIGGIRACQMTATAKTEAKLSSGQTGAALASGKDAVDTLGKTAAGAAATDTITRENDRAIRQSQGANVPVDPAANDIGLRAICRRAANRGKPECLQRSAP